MSRDYQEFFRPIWDDFDGELFQDLVVDLLRAEGYVVEPSGVGPDAGVDAFAQQWIRFGYSNPEPFVWAVQCKFKIDPNKNVSPSAVGEILNVVADERFKEKSISGYFLATNGRLSNNMMSQLRGLNGRLPGFKTTFWDRSLLHDVLNEHFKVYAKYFWPIIERHTDADKAKGYKDPVRQFQELLASSRTREADFAAFFEAHPEFLVASLGTGQAVVAQPILEREGGRLERPDFVLEPSSSTAPWTILELKRPDTPLVTSRTKLLSSQVMSGVAQLNHYRSFFDSPENREQLRHRVGVDVYRPRLTLLVGRDYGGLSREEVLQLKSMLPEVEIVTYTELLERYLKAKTNS